MLQLNQNPVNRSKHNILDPYLPLLKDRAAGMSSMDELASQPKMPCPR